VAVHIAAAEDGWLRLATEGGLPAGPRHATTRRVGHRARFKQALSEVHARTFAFLATIELEDLSRIVALPWDNSPRWGDRLAHADARAHPLRRDILDARTVGHGAPDF
jgi:uncharacterized damage-inducible protein DinB